MSLGMAKLLGDYMKKLCWIVLLAACTSCGDNSLNVGNDNQSPDNSITNTYISLEPEPNEEIPITNDSSINDLKPSIPITQPNDPMCDGAVMGPDGAGGFLWKPISDNDGHLVILFPPEFERTFNRVYVVNAIGLAEDLRFTGFANGNRQHWRASMSGDHYTGRVIAESSTGTCFWEVSNPSIRND